MAPSPVRTLVSIPLPMAPALFDCHVSINSFGKRVMSEIELLKSNSSIPAYRLFRSRLGKCWRRLCLKETPQNYGRPWHRIYATLSSCCEYSRTFDGSRVREIEHLTVEALTHQIGFSSNKRATRAESRYARTSTILSALNRQTQQYRLSNLRPF